VTFYHVLTIAGIGLIVALRLLMIVAPLAAKGGMGKRWQLWMLGIPRGSKPPHGNDIVM
jgi:hypothetical protein